MELDNQTKKRLLDDYQQVQEVITQILAGTIPNLYVRSDDWMTPTIESRTMPWEDKQSYFQYFTGIRDCLESLLTEGKPLPCRGTSKAPSYLAKLLIE